MSDPAISDAAPATRPRRRWLLAAVVACAVLAAAGVATFLATRNDNAGMPGDAAAIAAAANARDDPFTWDSIRDADFASRAAAGYAHVLYEKSPGGIVASARRTARWRPLIERAAADHGVDPDTMEAMVLLESAGRPDVIAGEDPEAASGLAQIVASTGIDLLGMSIDLPASQALTKQMSVTTKRLARARFDAVHGEPKVRAKARKLIPKLARQVPELLRRRRAVDERFQPAAALEGMGTYLEIAAGRFGDPDLATVSYHMGIGNLETAIGRYLGADASDGKAADLVAQAGLDYSQLFFDSSPIAHASTWSFLSSLGDDSSTYLWRVMAARRIMELNRDDPAELRRVDSLQSAKSTQEEVFHPEGKTEIFDDPAAIEAATQAGDLVRLRGGGGVGYRIDPQMGELASQFGVEPSLYRALRPEALATLSYIAAKVREINDGKGKLTVTSTVRDRGYQDALVGINGEATPNYSLHTTGYALDILRDYSGDSQAQAFQFALDRLRALDVIDYAVEPEAIHITVSNEAGALLKG